MRTRQQQQGKGKNSVPYIHICEAVFKPELRPAYIRWISHLSPEELQRFHAVFPRLAKDKTKDRPTTRDIRANKLMASKYTMPEWNILGVKDAIRNREQKNEDPLSRPTTQHLTHGNFDYDQMRTARAIPTRTRQNDVSQINATERSKAYMERWAEKMMNTTYRHDICHSGYTRTIHDETIDQTVLVYSKGVLTPEATERAKKFIDVDMQWTRAFREMCRSLADSIDATAYRNNFTTIKKANGERFTHPKWTDPIPVSRGLKKPAEAYWETTHRSDFKKSERPDETYQVEDLHRACYSCPFDHHVKVDKLSTTFIDDFLDHMAHKDDQPLYWEDMKVRIPPGSGVVGNVLGDGNIPVF
ncbi:hypothetical protein TRFO_28563 [Tritrichomonas foetus]|uniref:Uncharacterized protein n=1 Tax=Tritrichomonas foetus TaxID=1144522 RepID=A0A1J4K2R4_9EUKA|nr:hypothetical protein TRFO_28563 [Tritrichomonas foetus]|eukprot:OHT04022.1 hypothetical protein TRFO_28563 [Tritrichomonas foetus]